MPDQDPDVRLAITHSIKVLSRWTLALYVVVALVLGYGILASRATLNAVHEQADQTNKALCVFVGDLERRADDTARYLHKHPGKEPIPGITRADLRRSLENQRRTIESLSGLECDA